MKPTLPKVNKNKEKEYLRIVCRGLGLEVKPRHMWDLFINVSVNMYRMFNNANLTGYTKTGRVEKGRE